MNTRPLALAFALAFSLAAVATPAEATPSAKLTYVRGPGAETCPDESELRRAVAARLGYDPFFPTAPQTIVAQIHTRPRPDGRHGYRGDVQIVNEHGIVRGERALETKSEDCAEMVRALALGISIAVDDLDVIVAPPPPDPPDPAPPPPEAVPPPLTQPGPDAPASPPRVEAPTHPASLQLETLAGVRGSLGFAPALSAGVTVGVGIATPTASLRLEGTAELPSSARIDSGGSVISSFLVASLVPCVRRGVPFACAVASIGSFRGGTEGIAAPRSGSAFFAMAGARAGALLPVYARFSLAPHLNIAIPLVRNSIAVSSRTVFTSPAVGAGLGLDVQALFP